MRKRIIIYFLTALFILNCTPAVERYKNKARKALQKEDSVKALEYLQTSFELSLDRDYFPVGKSQQFSDVFSSVSRSKLILTENQPSKSKAYFTVYEISKGKDWSRRVRGYVHNVGIAPGGHFAVFNIEENENQCRLELWDLKKKERLSFSRSTLCAETPAVSDAGQVVFVSADSSISSYDLQTGKLDGKFVANTPTAPIKTVPAHGTIQFSVRGVLYFSYGSLGLYHLYVLKQGELIPINKDAASGKIYFMPGSDNPGLIIGGAGSHQVIFFNALDNFYGYKVFPLRFWKDSVFISEKEYYYIEDNRLIHVLDEQEKKLPFWATVVYANAGGKVYFLSPLGKLMSYTGVEPDQESRSIFQLGWEIK